MFDSRRSSARKRACTSRIVPCGERRAFIEGLLDLCKRGRSYLTLAVSAAADQLGVPRKRIQIAVNWMEQQGWLQAKVSQLRHAYHRSSEADAPVVVDSLVDRFEARERSDLARTDQIRAFAEGEGCLTARLVGHFGESRPEPCGHCGACLGQPSGPLPHTAPQELTELHEAVLARTRRANHPKLAHPRALARFLCGLSSPAFTGRGGLARHRDFGALQELPFAAVLRASESPPAR